MSAHGQARAAAPRRATSATLTAGVLTAAVFFAVSMILEILGAEPGDGEMTDLAAVVEGLFALTPWAWATIGAYAVVATPVIGLVVSASEYWSVGDRRTVLLAVGVIAVLGASVVVAVLR